MSAHQAQPEASTPISADALTDFIADQFLGGADPVEDNEDNPNPEDENSEGDDPDNGDDNPDDPENPDEKEDEPEAPAIAPPISWDKDAKELFAQLPSDLQAKVVEREAQREKAIQTATTEAATAKRNAAAEAQAQLAAHQRQYAQELEQIAARLAPQRPDPALAYSDPAAYVQAQAYFESANAQHQQWLQQADAVKAEAQERDNFALQHALAQDNQILSEKLGDDWTDATKRMALLTGLTEAGAVLGYDPQRIAQADAKDLLALKTAADWKSKAEKYDLLMASRTEAVRTAQTAPRVAKPGTGTGKAERGSQKRDAAWQRAKTERSGDAYAAVLENMGINLG